MRAKLPPEVVIDTYHAAFGLDEKPGAAAVGLAQYALVIIDEISQMQAHHFEHVCKLWAQADNFPVILLVGDELQMCGFGDRRAWTPPHKLDVAAVQKLLKSHPDTVILTCTRKGAQTINELALQLFPRFPPLAVLDGDVASNPENYDDGALLEDLRALRPLRLPIFKGMRAIFTHNVRKDVDFVNGMACVVQGYEGRTKAVEVLTATGHRVMGAELNHVTAFLDCPGVPGAAYTALNRVSFGKDVLVGGVVTAAHFQP
ncbi:ATP-dependent DNA helicase pif1, partial [Durusdinium trenchii]